MADLWLFGFWVLLGALYAFGGMLSFAVFALAMWKMPPAVRGRLPAAGAENGSAAPAR